MKRRVLFGGLFHETHTFLSQETLWSDFAVTRGEAIFGKELDESPTAGFLQSARMLGWEVVPTLDARAMPSGVVATDVLDAYWREFEPMARRGINEGIDAIFLVLHGAMATLEIEDVEGELLSRIRSMPGAADLPMFGVIDLHGNLTETMCACSNGLVAYRKNPHTDAKDTAVRAVGLLERCLNSGLIPRMNRCRVPVLWAPPGTGTHSKPMSDLIGHAMAVEKVRSDIWAFNIMAGFSFADSYETGVTLSTVSVAGIQSVKGVLEQGAKLAWDMRADGVVSYPTADEVLSLIGPDPDGLCLLVEPADNIGAGAPGDGTGILRAMISHNVARGLLAINDPHAVAHLRPHKNGSRIRVGIGGRGWRLDPGPVELEVAIVSQSDGEFDLEDPRSHLASISGSHFSMGPCAVVRYNGIHVLLTSYKTPPFDLGQFLSQGIDPLKFSIVGVKAAVAHKQAYDPITTASYWVATPGPCSSDLTNFPYSRLSRPAYPIDIIESPEFRIS
jgi:microcystin degradation protein MlrC